VSQIQAVAEEPQVGDHVALITGRVRYSVFMVEGDVVVADREQTIRTEDGDKATTRAMVQVERVVWRDLVNTCAASVTRIPE